MPSFDNVLGNFQWPPIVRVTVHCTKSWRSPFPNFAVAITGKGSRDVANANSGHWSEAGQHRGRRNREQPHGARHALTYRNTGFSSEFKINFALRTRD